MTKESARVSEGEAPDLVKDAKGIGALLAWFQSFIMTACTLRGDEMTPLEWIRTKANKVVPANIRFSLGFPSNRALNEGSKANPVEVWYPSMSRKRGRLTNLDLTPEKQKGMAQSDIPGPKVSDGYTEVFINPRIGAGLPPVERRFQVAIALMEGLLLAARGEPEPEKDSDRVRIFGGTYWTDKKAIGFDDANKREQKYNPLPGLRHFLDNILEQIGDLPVGALEAEPGWAAQRTAGFKVVCPYDLTPSRAEAFKAALGANNGEKIAASIRTGTIHTLGRASKAYNNALALTYCHRPHVGFDPKHPKTDPGPLQVVMLNPKGVAVPHDADPNTWGMEGEVILSATGTDGLPLETTAPRSETDMGSPLSAGGGPVTTIAPPSPGRHSPRSAQRKK